jgi:hypothetical protein
VHIRPEDESQHKVEETLDNESMVSFHLFFYTKQYCICVGNYQEWTGDVGLGQESKHKSQEKVEALIQRRRGKEEGEWYIRVE